MSYEMKYECGEQLDNFSQVSAGEKVIHKESGELYEVAGLLWGNGVTADNVLVFKNHLARYPNPIVEYCRAVPVKEQFEWVLENKDQTPFKDLSAEEMKLVVDAVYIETAAVFETFTCGAWWWHDVRVEHIVGGAIYRVKRELATPLDIPWEHVKEDFKYAAMDENGVVWVYEGLPVRGSEHWFGNNCIELKAIDIPTEGIDWKNSLTLRPSTVGA